MADVSLVWFSISDDAVSATRSLVRSSAEQHGLPADIIRESKIAAFTRACKLVTEYVDDEGQGQRLSAIEVKRTAEFLTFHVTRASDGYKVAEFKFFQSRRTREGIVRGTHLSKSVIRAHLPPATYAAGQMWLRRAEELFEATQEDAPAQILRRLVNAAMSQATTPIRLREGMYFVYADDIDLVYGVRDFLLECTTGSEFALLDVDDTSDYSVFAASADDHLRKQLEWANYRISMAIEPGRNAISRARRTKWEGVISGVRTQLARHERRLGQPLPSTRHTLLTTDQLVSKLPVQPACPK